MVKRIHVTGIKIFAIVMLLYSGNICFRLLSSTAPLTVNWTHLDLSKHLFEFDLSDPWNMSLLAIAFISLFPVALAYLIAGIGILRLKKWARTVGLYSSCIAVIVSFVVWLGFASLSRTLASMAPIDTEQFMIGGFYTIFIFLTLPALFTLVLLTRKEVKQCFTGEAIQESKGVTIFVILLTILFFRSIIQNYESFASSFDVPELYLVIWFWLSKTIYITAIFALLGLFLLKDVFRKIAIAAVLCDQVLMFHELYLRQTSLKIHTSYEVIFILFTILDLSFIYFLTRPKVKAQFQKHPPKTP